MRQDNAAIWREIAAMREENATEHAKTRADVRHMLDVTTEAIRHEIQLVAEAVVQTREDLVRRTTELDGKIDRTTAETRALVKFSYDSLDRRVTALETSAQ